MKCRSTFFLAAILCVWSVSAGAQCKPVLKIDGIATVIDANDQFGLQFPYWLREGQTLAVGSSVKSVSVIEFTVNGTALEFSQVLNITSTSPVTVPDDTVWKLESALKEQNSSSYKSVSFSVPGTYSWTTPSCAETICVELWGGGGGGAGGYYTGTASQRRPGGGGGGGGFGSECFAVSPNTTLSIVVGGGGIAGQGQSSSITASGHGQPGTNSSVGSLITAYGGAGGQVSTGTSTGGAGGSATSTSVAVGGTGGNASCNGCPSGAGGAGGNGGAGGASMIGNQNGQAGQAPGGAGSGGTSDGYNGAAGAAGRVIITW